MHLSLLATYLTLGLGAASQSLARVHGPIRLTKRDCGEGPDRICYGPDGGAPQNLDPEDISYVANYLRSLSEGKETSPIWNMPSEFQCSEWTMDVPGAGTVLPLIKHINPRTNSGVTFTDVARTIDGGGEEASDEDRANSLFGGCGENGGQMGVIVNLEDPTYNTTDYISKKMKPRDLIVKLVRAPGSQ